MRAMKDSGIEWIGQIPQEWHVDRLKYCANLDSEKLSEKTDPEYAFNYIDISSVTNIFLFASDRSKLVTTQRIGRALRLDKKNPNKKATVIDFILDDFTENDNNADQDRKEWLTKLSETRRNEDEE